jgi:hypothetical protein
MTSSLIDLEAPLNIYQRLNLITRQTVVMHYAQFRRKVPGTLSPSLAYLYHESDGKLPSPQPTKSCSHLDHPCAKDAKTKI